MFMLFMVNIMECEERTYMTHRIKKVIPLENFVVLAIFQDGVEKEYDMKQLFDTFPQFHAFKCGRNVPCAFKYAGGSDEIIWFEEEMYIIVIYRRW